MRKRAARRGFSLLEILITTGVVAMGLLALLGVLAFSVRSSRTGEVASLAMGHSIQMIELIRSRNLDFAGGVVPPAANSGINDPPDQRRALDAYPFYNDFDPDLPFRRNISIQRMGTSGNYDYEILLITVSVFWQENGQERSVTFEATHKKP
jgi:type II secretory pathway pseudopilin PulG